jgi:4-amino-4-deoxy-L-arabinose transferase-like glycosyltransferase
VRGITETREGRLTVIVVVAGTLLVVAAVANVWMANAADAEADEIRRSLRRGLAAVSDQTLDDFPDSGPTIEDAVGRALDDEPARVVRLTQPDGDEIVVAVETSWGWQLRCVEAELRGGGTVLTDHDTGSC